MKKIHLDDATKKRLGALWVLLNYSIEYDGTDKAIAERVLLEHKALIHPTMGDTDTLELARRLLARCEADALLDKAVEVKRYDLEDVISMGEAWREMNENEYGDWIRYDDHLAALRSRAEGVAEQDAIDAKRYRWLRQRPHVMAQFARDGDGVRKGGFHNRTLDEAIDKAVLEAAPTPPGGTKDEG